MFCKLYLFFPEVIEFLVRCFLVVVTTTAKTTISTKMIILVAITEPTITAVFSIAEKGTCTEHSKLLKSAITVGQVALRLRLRFWIITLGVEWIHFSIYSSTFDVDRSLELNNVALYVTCCGESAKHFRNALDKKVELNPQSQMAVTPCTSVAVMSSVFWVVSEEVYCLHSCIPPKRTWSIRPDRRQVMRNLCHHTCTSTSWKEGLRLKVSS